MLIKKKKLIKEKNPKDMFDVKRYVQKIPGKMIRYGRFYVLRERSYKIRNNSESYVELTNLSKFYNYCTLEHH